MGEPRHGRKFIIRRANSSSSVQLGWRESRHSLHRGASDACSCARAFPRRRASPCPVAADANMEQPVRRLGRPFVSPMGEPFRGDASGDGLVDWFNQADRNHDGLVTVDEMQRTRNASSRRSTSTRMAKSIPTRSIATRPSSPPKSTESRSMRPSRTAASRLFPMPMVTVATCRPPAPDVVAARAVSASSIYPNRSPRPTPTSAAALRSMNFGKAALDRFALLDTGHRGGSDHRATPGNAAPSASAGTAEGRPSGGGLIGMAAGVVGTEAINIRLTSSQLAVHARQPTSGAPRGNCLMLLPASLLAVLARSRGSRAPASRRSP